MNGMIENEAALFQPPQTKYPPAQFAFAALAILFVLYQVVGGGLTLLLLGGAITEENAGVARFATMFSQIIFLLLPTLYLAKRQNGRLFEVFQWRMPGFAESLLAVAGMVALMQVAETYLFLQNMIPVPESLAPMIEELKKAIEEAFKVLLVADSLPEMLFVMAVAALTPAICEELMFRGLIQKNFTLAYGSTKGFIISGAIFGLYHLNPFWLVPLVSLGIYFSFLQYRSRSLVLPIFAHFINNAAATIGVFVYGSTAESAPTLLTGAGMEPSLPMVLSTGVFFGILLFLIIVQYIRVTETVHNERRNDDYTT